MLNAARASIITALPWPQAYGGADVTKVYEVELKLGDIRHFFVKPEISPMSAEYQDYYYTSGIEHLVGELFANPSYKYVKTTLLLPADQITPVLEAETRSAIAHYCQVQTKRINHDLRGRRWHGTRSLLRGALLMFFIVGFGKMLERNDRIDFQVVSQGLIVAGTVIIEMPVWGYFLSSWESRLERRAYQKIMDMDLAIVPQQE